MRMALRRTNVLALGTIGLVAVLASGAMAATPEERAKCEAMVKKMGAPAPHDHGKDKTGAPNAMTAEHVRCKEILAEPAHGNKEGSKHNQN
jgi:hypothetical protein